MEGTAELRHVLESVRSIAGTLQTRMSRARDGTLYWCHPVPQAGKPFSSVPIGPHLYAGTLGIAFFLAAASRILGAEDLRILAMEAVAPLRREIREVAGDPARWRKVEHPIGGLSGLGSLVYGLLRIGDMLEDATFASDAHTVASLITRERIVSDERFDVMTGSAGALLGLLALDERQPGRTLNGATPLELASACASHLARGSSSPFLKGYCHGREGIAVALLRLYEKTGQLVLLKMARRMVEQVSPKSLDDSGEKTWARSWCAGAPGMALYGLCSTRATADPSVLSEIARALQTTGHPVLSETDDLCCGNSGRLDVLVHAGRTLGDPACLEAAFHLASKILARAAERGSFSLKLDRKGIQDLRLFNGLAGIGYALLRLVAPSSVPCVVALE